MGKLILSLFIVCTLFSNVVRSETEEDQPFSQSVYDKLTEIGKTKFGKEIIDSVAVQMAAGDPAQDLINLLQEIEDQIEAEQDEDDKYIQKLQDECDENLARLQSEITQATERSNELQAELDVKIPLRESKEETLKQKNEFRDMIVNKLAELEQQKSMKDKEWEEEQEQHDAATAAIEKVKQLLRENSKSFLQKDSTAFAQVASSIRSSIKSANFKRQSWNTFLQVLASISEDLGPQADQDGVAKVIEICEDILDKIAESREIERKDYQHWIEEYNNHKFGLNEKLSEVDDQITKLTAEIATLTKRINEATYEKSEQDKRIKDKTTQHDEKLQYCDDENKGYAERREQRNDERSIVSQTIGLFQANLRTFRKYVRDRQDAV